MLHNGSSRPSEKSQSGATGHGGGGVHRPLFTHHPSIRQLESLHLVQESPLGGGGQQENAQQDKGPRELGGWDTVRNRLSNIVHAERQGVQRLTMSDVESMAAAAVLARDSNLTPPPRMMPKNGRGTRGARGGGEDARRDEGPLELWGLGTARNRLSDIAHAEMLTKV